MGNVKKCENETLGLFEIKLGQKRGSKIRAPKKLGPKSQKKNSLKNVGESEKKKLGLFDKKLGQKGATKWAHFWGGPKKFFPKKMLENLKKYFRPQKWGKRAEFGQKQFCWVQ